MLENTLENPLDSKDIKAVNPKEINPEYSLEGLINRGVDPPVEMRRVEGAQRKCCRKTSVFLSREIGRAHV